MRILFILFFVMGTITGCAPAVIVAGMGAAAYYSSINDTSSTSVKGNTSSGDIKEKVISADSIKNIPTIVVKRNSVERVDKLLERKHEKKVLPLNKQEIAKNEELKTSKLKYDKGKLNYKKNRTGPDQESLKMITKKSLLGLGSDSLVSVLGNPTLLRREPPGQVWLYKNKDCVIHIFLYEKGKNKKYTVSYIEGNNSILGDKNINECITSLALTYKEKAGKVK